MYSIRETLFHVRKTEAETSFSSLRTEVDYGGGQYEIFMIMLTIRQDAADLPAILQYKSTG